MHTKRRQNSPMNGGGNNGPQRQYTNNNNNRPRRFNNNRPQGGENDAANVSRTRRSATQNREKYQMMARDALAAGDRVLAENYLQHAEHYYRVLAALPPEQVPPPQYLPRSHPNAIHHESSGNSESQDQGGASESQSTGHIESNGGVSDAGQDHHAPGQHDAATPRSLPAYLTDNTHSLPHESGDNPLSDSEHPAN